MRTIRQLCIWPSLLSLDAPLIAVLWQLLFARSLHTHLPVSATLVLALVLWLIYVGDRILDSFQEPSSEEPLRHRFYRAHRWAYAGPFCAVLAVSCWMAWRYIRPDVQRAGLVLATAVILYFALVHALPSRAKEWFPKELVVALVFAIGTCLPIGARMRDADAAPFLIPLVLFALVLWMNALFIEYSEWTRLRREAEGTPHSLTILAGRYFLLFSGVVGAAAVVAMAVKTLRVDRPILVAEALSVLALEGLGLYRSFVPIDVVGPAADAALLAPCLLLLILGK